MQDSTGIEDFYKKNNADVQSMVHSQIWYDKDLQEDMQQKFYLRLCTDPILERYDSSRGVKFSTYIYGCLANCINATFQPIRETVVINEDTRSYDPEPYYDLTMRVHRFQDYITANTDSTRPLDYLRYKAQGKRVADLGQLARNEYTDLLCRFLQVEKLSEDLRR